MVASAFQALSKELELIPQTLIFLERASANTKGGSGYPRLQSEQGNWAREASPTLGCSIEISRDIYNYVGMYVRLSYVKSRGIT